MYLFMHLLVLFAWLVRGPLLALTAIICFSMVGTCASGLCDWVPLDLDGPNLNGTVQTGVGLYLTWGKFSTAARRNWPEICDSICCWCTDDPEVPPEVGTALRWIEEYPPSAMLFFCWLAGCLVLVILAVSQTEDSMLPCILWVVSPPVLWRPIKKGWNIVKQRAVLQRAGAILVEARKAIRNGCRAFLNLVWYVAAALPALVMLGWDLILVILIIRLSPTTWRMEAVGLVVLIIFAGRGTLMHAFGAILLGIGGALTHSFFTCLQAIVYVGLVLRQAAMGIYGVVTRCFISAPLPAQLPQ